MHHCTPWRGLNVLLLAMQLIQNKNVTLDVYSSNDVYGKEFADRANKDTEALFNQAKQLPNVNYIGYKPNEYILEHITIKSLKHVIKTKIKKRILSTL